MQCVHTHGGIRHSKFSFLLFIFALIFPYLYFLIHPLNGFLLSHLFSPFIQIFFNLSNSFNLSLSLMQIILFIHSLSAFLLLLLWLVFLFDLEYITCLTFSQSLYMHKGPTFLFFPRPCYLLSLTFSLNSGLFLVYSLRPPFTCPPYGGCPFSLFVYDPHHSVPYFSPHSPSLIFFLTLSAVILSGLSLGAPCWACGTG